MFNKKLTDRYLIAFKIDDDPFAQSKLTLGQKLSDKLSSIGGYKIEL